MKLRILLLTAAISLAALALPAQDVAKKAPAKKGAKTVAPAVQHNDEAYTKKILEYTTEKYFLTELIDHLPASDTVPTPDKVIGHIVGAPDHLTYSKDIYAYMDALAKASPRVKVFRMGKSEEGRDMLCVAISDEESIKNLDHYKEINAKLADPRKTTPQEAEKLIAEAKPMYW